MDDRFAEGVDFRTGGRKILTDRDRLRIMKLTGKTNQFVIIVYHHREDRFSQHICIFEDWTAALEVLERHRNQMYLEDADWSDQTARWEYLRPGIDAPPTRSMKDFFKNRCRSRERSDG